MMPQNNSGGGQSIFLALSIGEGKTRPQANYIRIEPTVMAVAEALRTQPATVERWWSMHLWKGNKRNTVGWKASCGVVIDVDYAKPGNPSAELVERLRNAASTNDLPGTIFHLTPHGARLVWVYDKVCSDRIIQQKAERGAATLIAKALEKLNLTEYQVDTSPLGDLARFFYTPNSVAKGVARSAEVFIMREELANPADLTIHDVPARVVETPKEKKPPTISFVFDAAVVAWNTDHPQDWPKNSAPCPFCGDSGSFGQLPEDPTQWFCFSTDHKKYGTKTAKGFKGDPLDFEAFKRGCKPVEVLRNDGYLRKSNEVDIPPNPPNTQPQETPIGYWRSHSYSTAVGIIKQNFRDVLEGRKLELNDMTGEIEIGRKPIIDADAQRIRYLMETYISGGVDKKGNQVGLQLSAADVVAAINQVAHEQPYHPVRNYLCSLKWDGTERIKHVVKYLGAQDTAINQIIIKRFFIGAAARPLNPGCKHDTVFILVGKQGAYKSSFFQVLTDPWFIDTPIDIFGDAVRAYMTMRKAWIMEWAELESLLRARRAGTTAVKSFLSSRSDSYVPKHARYSIHVKRGGVFVGTTNQTEFLDDDSGERRYWPVTVGDNINLDKISEQRDQLWAEAVMLYQNQNRHWFTAEEAAMLDSTHAKHEISDVWAGPILEYLAKRDTVSVQDVLSNAIHMPVGQWTGRDVSRVCRVLKGTREWKVDPNKVKGQPRTWYRHGDVIRGPEQQALQLDPHTPTTPIDNKEHQE